MVFLLAVSAALAEEPVYEAMTFTRLIFEDEEEGLLGISGEEFRQEILKMLEKNGLNVKGGGDERLLFGKDDTSEARFMLGGTFEEIVVDEKYGETSVEIAVSWQLFDNQEDGVVYTTTTRGFTQHRTTDYTAAEGVGRELMTQTVDRLAERERFVALLSNQPVVAPQPRQPITLRRCGQEPGGIPGVLGATWVLRQGNSSGSAVMLSPDGYLLTAAHVVSPSGTITARPQEGEPLNASLLLRDTRQDVALLRVEGDDFGCLQPVSAAPDVGEAVLVAGAPLGDELDFSLSRGIVSGNREIRQNRYIQTDASINPGNSGGPMASEDGQLIGVSSWKIAGEGLEGLGFGVPVEAALETLAITLGDQTTESLSPIKVGDATYPIRDPDDEPIITDSWRTEQEAAFDQKVAETRARRIQASRPIGYVVTGVSLAAVAWSWNEARQLNRTTPDEWDSLKTTNQVGWGGAVIGGLLIARPALAGLRVEGTF